jgi:DNA-binding transcriptional ArsR family regulator
VPTEALMDLEPVFAALADTTRLHLLIDLGDHGPRSLVRLAATTSLTRQAVTKHLRTLEGAGVVRSRRIGRERIWQLDTERLGQVGSALDLASRRWDAALERLRVQVESEPTADRNRAADDRG